MKEELGLWREENGKWRFEPDSDGQKREGFWSDENVPVANKKPWSGQKRFIEFLSKVEGIMMDAHIAHVRLANEGKVKYKETNVICYRGYSFCRVCGWRSNGTSEFNTDGWIWPEGFIHYIEKHNLKPSDAFIAFIEKKANEK